MSYSLNQLYDTVGISKQAVFKYQKQQVLLENRLEGLLVEAEELRSEHPGCGVETMYYTLQPDFIGRDKFIDLFMQMGYRVKRNKNYRRTTVPTSLKYPNLIEGMIVKDKNTLWQSDITYYEVNGRFYYLVFIIDVFTRQIVGYSVSDSLRAEANIKALKMAYKNHGIPLIHHSDRGSQYIDKGYLKLLQDHNVQVSMGLKAQDNAYAERINGTVKNDYLKYWDIKSYGSLKYKVGQAVNHYNSKRIHSSLPERYAPNVFARKRKKYRVLEELYAPNRITPPESTFRWCDEVTKNDLFCMIN